MPSLHGLPVRPLTLASTAVTQLFGAAAALVGFRVPATSPTPLEVHANDAASLWLARGVVLGGIAGLGVVAAAAGAAGDARRKWVLVAAAYYHAVLVAVAVGRLNAGMKLVPVGAEVMPTLIHHGLFALLTVGALLVGADDEARGDDKATTATTTNARVQRERKGRALRVGEVGAPEFLATMLLVNTVVQFAGALLMGTGLPGDIVSDHALYATNAQAATVLFGAFVPNCVVFAGVVTAAPLLTKEWFCAGPFLAVSAYHALMAGTAVFDYYHHGTAHPAGLNVVLLMVVHAALLVVSLAGFAGAVEGKRQKFKAS